MSYFLVMAGGAIGSAARFGVYRATLAWFGPGFPWGTVAVNLLGSLAMGLLIGALARFGEGGEQARQFLAVGVLGGFTTFSSFSLDAVTLFERGAVLAAGGYVVLSVLGALAGLVAGLSIVRGLA